MNSKEIQILDDKSADTNAIFFISSRLCSPCITLVKSLGLLGITLSSGWNEPAIFNNSNHIEAAETRQQFETGWFAHPIYIDGKYPEIMRQKVRNSK